MLTKEKCEKALLNLEFSVDNLNCGKEMPCDECEKKCDTRKQYERDCELMEQLVEKYFDNPSLKFEELKPNMWVWDNEQKKYLKIIDVIDWDEDDDEPAFLIVFEPNEYDCWVENRFYRKEVKVFS